VGIEEHYAARMECIMNVQEIVQKWASKPESTFLQKRPNDSTLSCSIGGSFVQVKVILFTPKVQVNIELCEKLN
jgi:hypothetical protein